jgi:AsmA protein
MKKQHIWIGGVILMCLFAAATWAVTHPGFAVAQLQDYVLRKTGRDLAVGGDVKLAFSPELSIGLADVTLSNPKGMGGVFANVGNVRLPIRYGDLFRRKLKIERFSLENAHFNFLINGQGQGNWSMGDGIPGDGTVKSDKTATEDKPLEFLIESSAVSYLDERSGQAFSLENASGKVETSKNGEIDLAGTTALNSQFAKIEAHLKSLPRVSEDGSPADIAIRSPALDLNFSGRLGTHNSLALVGTVDASSPDLRALAKWLGNTMGGDAGLKKFSLTSAVDSSGSVFNLSKANIGIDGMQASGTLSADFSNKIPQISGSLSTNKLDLDAYLISSSGGAAKAESESWSVVSNTFKALRGIEGELSLSAFLISWKGAEWGPVELSTRLKGGVLTADFQDATLYGGKGTGKIEIDASKDIPDLTLDFDGRDMIGDKFFAQLIGLNWLKGTTALKTSLTASGQNQQELMSSLKGALNIAISNGEIKGVDIMDAVSKVSAAILKGWADAPNKFTAFDTALANFSLADGVATSTDIAIANPQVSVTGAGEVDMLRRAVDLKFDPHLATGDGETTSLPVKIAVKGPWDSPKIYPDVNGVLDNPEAAYKSLQDMGLPEVSGKDVKKAEKKAGKILKKLLGN